MTSPTPPISLTGSASRFAGGVEIPAAAIEELRRAAPTDTDATATAEASRDWWPLAMHWALDGRVPRRAGAVCHATTEAHVVEVVKVCARHTIPLTVAAGRSGVCGGSVPALGGVVLDVSGLQGVSAVDETSGLVTAWAGTFGPDVERVANEHGLTIGHFPQSFDISTVGGWAACNGAGQFSTRYGKFDRIVAGLRVVLADGRVLHTGDGPAASAGLDLTRVFIGSEGTLGVITSVTMRAHPRPPARAMAAWRIATFDDGLECCRRVLRRGATPAVLRLYDEIETQRSFDGDGTWCALVVLDDADPTILEATMRVVSDVATSLGAVPLGEAPAQRWLEHRNDTSALQSLVREGYVVDTMEVAAPWSALPDLAAGVRTELRAVPGCLAASCHLSHSYPDGACLYFTFAASPPDGDVEATYVRLWDVGQRAALARGANLSHHHGIGLNRARFVSDANPLGAAVANDLARALDPQGIFNPAKLGRPSPFGQAEWP